MPFYFTICSIKFGSVNQSLLQSLVSDET